MTRLRIGVEQLGADGFRLELAGADGKTNVIALTPGGGIRGRYEHDDHEIGLHAIRADTLRISELSWCFGTTRVEATAASRLHEVEIDAKIGRGEGARPFAGAIRARTIEATVELSVGTTKLHGLRLEVRDFELDAGKDGTLSVRFGAAKAASVTGRAGPLEFELQDVAVMRGAVGGGAVGADELLVSGAQLHVAELGGGPGTATMPELPLLDHLTGKVDVDLGVDVVLPVIGSRVATHRFRIPLRDGVLDYATLEAGLSALEDLVIDLKLRNDRLVLEKDIPLVPFDNRPLVEWPLDTEGQALARDGRVRLATLLHPTLPDAQGDSSGSVQLRRLAAENVDVDLAVSGPSTLNLGGVALTLTSAAALRLTGSLEHVPGDAKPGALHLGAQRVLAGLAGFPIGTRRAEVPELELAQIDDVELTFDGLRPTSVSAKLTDAAVRRVVVR